MRALRFVGNTEFPATTLAASVATLPSSFSGLPLFGERRCLDPVEFARDMQRIVTLYRRRGFPDVTVDTTVTTRREGVIDITFTYGKDFPLGTCIAVRDLAAQLVAAISCQCECSLPARVVSYVKGDTAFTFIDPEVLAELRLSGIASLDTLIRAFGGNKRPTVYSPDIHRSECVRWTRVTA